MKKIHELYADFINKLYGINIIFKDKQDSINFFNGLQYLKSQKGKTLYFIDNRISDKVKEKYFYKHLNSDDREFWTMFTLGKLVNVEPKLDCTIFKIGTEIPVRYHGVFLLQYKFSILNPKTKVEEILSIFLKDLQMYVATNRFLLRRK